MAKKQNDTACLDKYKEIFKELDGNRKVFAEKLMAEAVHMENTLAKLKAQVNEEGAIITSVNGNGFETINEHPAQKSYNIMIRNYNSTLKQLEDMAPEGKKQESRLKALMDDD